MNTKSTSVAPIISVVPSGAQYKPEGLTVGAEVFVLLHGGKEDGQVVKAKVRGFDGSRIIITYEREGVLAIESVPAEDVSQVQEDFEHGVSSTRIGLEKLLNN